MSVLLPYNNVLNVPLSQQLVESVEILVHQIINAQDPRGRNARSSAYCVSGASGAMSAAGLTRRTHLKGALLAPTNHQEGCVDNLRAAWVPHVSLA
jgi:hypothetical protein